MTYTFGTLRSSVAKTVLGTTAVVAVAACTYMAKADQSGYEKGLLRPEAQDFATAKKLLQVPDAKILLSVDQEGQITVVASKDANAKIAKQGEGIPAKLISRLNSFAILKFEQNPWCTAVSGGQLIVYVC
jgi:hypothetical protein